MRSVFAPRPERLDTILDKDGTIRYEAGRRASAGLQPRRADGKNAFGLPAPDDRKRSGRLRQGFGRPGQGAASCGSCLLTRDGSWRRVDSIRTNLLNDPAVRWPTRGT